MRLSLIVAMSRNGVIGREGQLPWRLSADLRRFKRLTMGHHMIMGRKTFEYIGRPLPGRTSIVITRQPKLLATEALVAHDLQSAIKLAAGDEEVFVVGGAEIYRLALPHADRLYLTEVQAEVAGDATFPDLNRHQWRTIERSTHPADDRNEYSHTFSIMERLPRSLGEETVNR